MAETIVLPQQGNSVEEVVLLEWKVQLGDSISEGDVVCEVETDKATMEVEATASGTVLALLAGAGDEVPVKTPILVVGKPGEDYSDLDLGNESGGAAVDTGSPDRTSTTDTAAAPVGAAPGTAQPQATPGTDSGAVSPRARMRAAERGIDPGKLSGSGPQGRVIERDVLAADVPSTAAARAAGLGSQETGSAIGGRVAAGDLGASRDTSALAASPDTAMSTGTESSGPAEVAREIPVSGVRKVIAERMLASLQDTAQLTLHSSADARAMQRLRKRFKSAGEAMGLAGVTLNDMVMYAVVRTLPDFPDLNAHFLGSSIKVFRGVDISFAVDTPRGLLVPTVQGAGGLSLAGLSSRVKELAGRAVEGKAGPADLAMGTFTVTNLGAFGIERFTPVLNPPQVAILGVGSIELKPIPAASGEGVDHVPHIGLSLTIDHQAVDGAPGARFLGALATAIANFDLLLAR